MKQIEITNDFEQKLRRITSNFGITTQLIKLNEEMGELLNEGYYGAYKGDNKNSLEDACADVLNVLVQVMLYFDLDWKKMYGKLLPGRYRIVKDASINSDLPCDAECTKYYFSVEFDIE